MRTKVLHAFRNRYLISTAVVLTIAGLANVTLAPSVAAAPTSVNADSADVTSLIEKSRQALKQGHPDEALIYLKNAETAAPQSAAVHFYLGQAFLATRNPSAAQRELNVARQKGIPAGQVLPWIFDAMLAQRQGQLLLNQFPAPPTTDRNSLANDTLRARALAQIQAGNKQEAAASLDQALSVARTTKNLVARSELAQDMGDSTVSQNLLDEAFAKDPTNTDVLSAKINSVQKSKDPAKAVPYADSLVKATNGAPLSKVIRAGVYLQLKQDDKASRDLDEALAAAPNLPPAILFKAIIKERAKDPKGAWALAQSLPREFMPSKPEIGIAVSQIAMDAGQLETGIDILHSTSQLFPTNADVRIRLALAHLRKNDLVAASESLAPLESSNNPAAIALLGQVAAKQNRPDLALKYMEKANQLGFGGQRLSLRLASSQIQHGDLADAERSLRALYAKQPSDPEVVGPFIALLLRKGDFATAAKTAADLSRTAPNNPYGPFYEGEVFIQQAKTDAALSAFEMAAKRDPKFYAAMYYHANLLAGRGDLERAQADLEGILAANPKYTPASLRLAKLLEQTGAQQKALLTLEKAAAANPGDLSVCSALARSYATQRRWSEASATVSNYLRRSPKDINALILLADIEIQSGTPDKAIGMLLGQVKGNPGSADLSVILSRAYLRKADYAAACAVLLRAIGTNSKAESLRIALIQTELASKDEKGALADARTYAKDFPGVSSTQLLSTVLFVAKQGDEAEAILQKAVSATPDTRIVLQLSAVLKARGKNKASDDLLRAWISKHPKDSAARQTYALSKLESDQATAEQQLRQLLVYDQSNLMALNNLAWLLSERDPAKAADYAALALKLAPALPSVLDTYGWVKWQLKDGPAALASLQRAHQGSPADPEIAFHYAAVLAGSNRRAEAQKVLAAALTGTRAFQDKAKAQELSRKLAP